MENTHDSQAKDKESCEQSRCPTPNAHVRLSDAHRLWHQTLEEYSNPEGFRVNLNSTIQTLRNVTFVLQKQKALIPHFDEWYPQWQERMGADPIMKWLVAARNQVVKEGDLDTHSVTRVRILAKWGESPHQDFIIPPLTRNDEIAALSDLESLPEHIKTTGILAIERRWVATDLPDHELLDALAHCYGVISQLISDAHTQAGVSVPIVLERFSDGACDKVSLPDSHTKGRLPCMIATTSSRTSWMTIRDQQVCSPESIPMPIDREDSEKVATRRYGLGPQHFQGIPSRGLFNDPKYLLDTAKKVLKRDGHHNHIVFLEDAGGRLHIHTLVYHDQAEKVLSWNVVAQAVERLGVRRLASIAEVWISELHLGRQAASARRKPKRKEGLEVVIASSDGSACGLCSEFKRRRKRIVFQETRRLETLAQYAFLDPVQRVWRTWASEED